jgi:transmembrane sensor
MAHSPASNLVKYALTRLARIEIASEESAQPLQRQLDAWRKKSPDHEAAYQIAVSQLQSVSSMASQLQEQFSKPASTQQRRIRQSRTTQALMSWGALALFCAALVEAGIWYWHQPIYQAQYHTGIAQLQEITLPDGSQLSLNAKTDLQVTLYRQKRNVTLDTGEARFKVSHNSRRPFHVATRLGNIEVVGTIFTVSDRGRAVTLSVEQGHVRFHQQHKEQNDSAATFDLTANEQLLIQNDGLASLGKVQAADASAWRKGWLVFNNSKLEDALPTINAFRHQPLTLAEENAAQLRLTGRFRAQDQRALEQALPEILPITLKPGADHTLELLAK